MPDAAQTVAFEVGGPVEIIGIGNGDLSNFEDSRSRAHPAYQGRGLAILRSTKTPGGITVKATAPGLAPAMLVLQSRK